MARGLRRGRLNKHPAVSRAKRSCYGGQEDGGQSSGLIYFGIGWVLGCSSGDVWETGNPLAIVAFVLLGGIAAQDLPFNSLPPCTVCINSSFSLAMRSLVFLYSANSRTENTTGSSDGRGVTKRLCWS